MEIIFFLAIGGAAMGINWIRDNDANWLGIIGLIGIGGAVIVFIHNFHEPGIMMATVWGAFLLGYMVATENESDDTKEVVKQYKGGGWEIYDPNDNTLATGIDSIRKYHPSENPNTKTLSNAKDRENKKESQNKTVNSSQDKSSVTKKGTQKSRQDHNRNEKASLDDSDIPQQPPGLLPKQRRHENINEDDDYAELKELFVDALYEKTDELKKQDDQNANDNSSTYHDQ
jgi:hypothetical protein